MHWEYLCGHCNLLYAKTNLHRFMEGNIISWSLSPPCSLLYPKQKNLIRPAHHVIRRRRRQHTDDRAERRMLSSWSYDHTAGWFLGILGGSYPRCGWSLPNATVETTNQRELSYQRLKAFGMIQPRWKPVFRRGKSQVTWSVPTNHYRVTSQIIAYTWLWLCEAFFVPR